MKTLFCCTLLLSTSIAHADLFTFELERSAGMEPATGEYAFELLGRGIQDEETGEVIAVACAGERDPATGIRQCDRLRHLYFKNGAREAIWVGDTIRASAEGQTPTRVQLKRALKELSRQYKLARREARANSGAYILYGVGLGLPFALTYGFPAAAGAFPVVTVVGIPAYAVLCIFLARANRPFGFPAGTGLLKVSLGPEGWNWEARPKRLSPKNFEIYARSVARI